jgi:hypothetical protein
MTDQILLAKIKKLANAMQENTLYDYEYSGYMKDKIRRDIFRRSAKHNVLLKKKHAYIDQESSGKLMVQIEPDARKNRAVYPVGSVFSIKAYGQKNRYLGDVDKVIVETEKANESMLKRVMERANKNYLKRGFI